MKKRNLLDKIATWGIRIALLIVGNQVIYPEVLNNWADSWQTNGTSRIATKYIEFPHLSNLNFDARNYLYLANSIVSQNIVKEAVCRNYAKATLEVCRELIEKADKKGLINCIRTAFDGEHNWLEIREGGDWIKY